MTCVRHLHDEHVTAKELADGSSLKPRLDGVRQQHIATFISWWRGWEVDGQCNKSHGKAKCDSELHEAKDRLRWRRILGEDVGHLIWTHSRPRSTDCTSCIL